MERRKIAGLEHRRERVEERERLTVSTFMAFTYFFEALVVSLFG